MSNTNTAAEKSSPAGHVEPESYVAPTVVALGSLRALTQGSGGSDIDGFDEGQGSMGPVST